MKHRHSLIVSGSIFSLLVFSGCGSSQVKLVSEDVRDLRTISAEHTAELGDIREQLRVISGQIEELQYQAVGKAQELEKSLARLGSRVPPPESVPQNLLEEDDQKISRISGESAMVFANGLKKLRVGAFDEAIGDFRRFLSENPETSFSDNSYFWLGVCFESLGKYEDAIGAYSNSFQRFPAEDRAAVSLLHLGKVFIKLGSKSDAKLAFQKLVDDYPKSNYVTEARGELKKL